MLLFPLQEGSADITKDKYLLSEVSEQTPDMIDRVATAVSNVEDAKKRKFWKDKFVWAMEQGAFPAGRILSNAGAEQFKPATSTINCTVSGTIRDSMQGIMERATEAALTLKAGCGIGYDFTTVRPKGGFVRGAGASTSGVLPFMDIFDSICKTVSSSGGRRGAQMGVLDVCHPDIFDFVKAKRENGRLRAFNLSVGVSEEFTDVLSQDGDWKLYFPAFKHEIQMETCEIVWKEWPNIEPEYTTNEYGEVACKVYRTVKARQLWDVITTSTFNFAEPGILLIGRANKMNPLWFAELIRASNPCGEQMLPPYGACLLGSVNLAYFVKDAFKSTASFDYERYKAVCKVFARMLDNVVELNNLPLPQQREEIQRKRRHGMGYMGLGSAICMLNMQYGDEESVKFTDKVTLMMAIANWEAAVELAKEKGCAPILGERFTVTPKMIRQRPEMANDGIKVGDEVEGKVLWAKYSRYFQNLAKVAPDLVNDLIKYGGRFTHATSIAPTGTIASGPGNNVSNGIEPSFSHSYIRNKIVEGESAKRAIPMYSFELLMYRDTIDPSVVSKDGNGKEVVKLPEQLARNTSEVHWKNHVNIQAAAQQWVDSSISKTINVPQGIPFGEFQGVYEYAIDCGLKGCTTFRFNPEAFQGVLVNEDTLAATEYEFTLETGEVVTVKGNEKVTYQGETFTAANLFDAIKEGYYGRL